jgi:N-acetylneuraminic acid mutarotase
MRTDRLIWILPLTLVAVAFGAAAHAKQHVALGTAGPVLPPLQGQGRWGSRASLPIARGEVAVAEVGGRIYVLGGYANGFADQPLNEEYDPATNSWSERAPMPRGLNHVAAVGWKGKIYCFGGFTSQGREAAVDVNVYDPSHNDWKALAPLPSAVGAAATAVLDGKIHLVGGFGKESVATHRVYDPETNIWSNAAPLPGGLDHLGLAAIGGKLYAVGGQLSLPYESAGCLRSSDGLLETRHAHANRP